MLRQVIPELADLLISYLSFFKLNPCKFELFMGSNYDFSGLLWACVSQMCALDFLRADQIRFLLPP